MEGTELSVANASIKLKLNDFRNKTDKITEYHSETYQNCSIVFSATVFSDGVDEDSEEWLVFRVRAIVYNNKSKVETFRFKWSVSMIDIEGSLRFTQYFENHSNSYSIQPINESGLLGEFSGQSQLFRERSSISEFAEARYLEKSFILDRADEFLSSGALFLKCDIFFDLSGVKYFMYIDDEGVLNGTYKLFMRSILRAVCYKESAETANQNDTFKVFDFTSEILTLPQFHELRRRFGVYGIPPKFTSLSSESEENVRDIQDHVWIFDTRPHRFLLSLAPNPRNIGHLLVNSSPVIKRCVNAPMREQLEKRIEFKNVDSLTFKIVLHFLKSGNICNCKFSPAVEVYKFFHLYEMHDLQIKCADQLMKRSKTKTHLKELEKIAKFHSDDYLLRLLQSHKKRNTEDLDTFVRDDRSNFECYK